MVSRKAGLAEEDELVFGDAGFACPRNEAFTVQGITLYESRNVRGQMAYTPLHKELFV